MPGGSEGSEHMDTSRAVDSPEEQGTSFPGTANRSQEVGVERIPRPIKVIDGNVLIFQKSIVFIHSV